MWTFVHRRDDAWLGYVDGPLDLQVVRFAQVFGHRTGVICPVNIVVAIARQHNRLKINPYGLIATCLSRSNDGFSNTSMPIT